MPPVSLGFIVLHSSLIHYKWLLNKISKLIHLLRVAVKVANTVELDEMPRLVASH